MNKKQELPQFNQGQEKPADWLPDGSEQTAYIKRSQEWPNLEKRLGQPRILDHVYCQEIISWIKEKFKDQPQAFSFFEACSGHGNDLRAFRNKLGQIGRFLGIDISQAEIERGLKFYHERDGEVPEEAAKLFAQGDLLDLKHLNAWDEEKKDFSRPLEIKDEEFDLAYMEANLHAFGYGKKTFQEKRQTGQLYFNEICRILKPGGKLFGRANTFNSTLPKDEQLEQLRQTNEWRFFPDDKELLAMIKQAGFTKIKTLIAKHEKANIKPTRKDFLNISFLAEKTQ